jgi:hypothetical protein
MGQTIALAFSRGDKMTPPAKFAAVTAAAMFGHQSRRTAVAIFAVALTVAVIAAFITTFEGVSTRQASNEAQPGTTGLAHPHPALDVAPGEPVRN